MPGPERTILVFGGTFDPPHRAHATLPRLAADALGADEIVLLPAARNPLKADGPTASDADRLAMLALVAAEDPRLRVSRAELERGGASYFVDTLEALRAEVGDGPRLRFLIGADHAIDFHRWHRWERILELAEPAVMLRPPWDRTRLAEALRERVSDEAEARWWEDRVVDLPIVDVSASDLRARLAAGDESALDELLLPSVAAYVREHGLYGIPTAR